MISSFIQQNLSISSISLNIIKIIDDVKCSHGCTIGQLDEEALFYMRSRGIGVSEAKAVLTYAFASEVIENLSIPELKNLSQKLLAHKLNVDLDFSL